MKRYSFFLFLVIFFSCQEDVLEYKTINGKTMGTTYNVVFETDQDEGVIQKKIDSLLLGVNSVLSTYIESATISRFNSTYSKYLEEDTSILNDYFVQNYKISAHIHELSNGAFDPTVMPIVNYWGFGYDGRKKVTEIDSAKVNSLMKHVGFDKLQSEGRYITKIDTLVELDFSGVAKGFGVDVVSSFLATEGINNYYVEIGGELFAQGVNPSGINWRTGISVPLEGSSSSQFQQILEVSGKGIATSGNYRNFYQSNGEIFSHTINPKTGFPERSKLLSATIIAESCALADGYATACMVLGLEKSIDLVNLQEEIEGILVYVDQNEELQVFDSTKK